MQRTTHSADLQPHPPDRGAATRGARAYQPSRRRTKGQGRAVSTLLLNARQATQRSVEFIRWLRGGLRKSVTTATALPRLAALYAEI